MMKKLVIVGMLLFSVSVFAATETKAPVYTPTPAFQAVLNPVGGKVIEAKAFGPVTVVHASVMGADHSDAFYIVAKNTIVNIDDYSILSQLNIKLQPNYATLAQKYPNISIWPGNHTFPESKDLGNGITQLIFSYSMLNGCHACELGGFAKVGFNFDKDGNYVNAQLLSLSPAPVSQG